MRPALELHAAKMRCKNTQNILKKVARSSTPADASRQVWRDRQRDIEFIQSTRPPRKGPTFATPGDSRQLAMFPTPAEAR